jgi:hypothetical protein
MRGLGLCRVYNMSLRLNYFLVVILFFIFDMHRASIVHLLQISMLAIEKTIACFQHHLLAK